MVRWRILCACAVLFPSLNGCVLFAPEVAFQPRKDSALRSGANANIMAAEAYANEVRTDIVSLEIQASILKSSSTLALLGTSGASVGAAAFRGSRDLIAGFSVATAGLLSLQYGTGIASKQAILDNAREAIDCAIQTAEKLDSTPAIVGASTGTVAVGPGRGRSGQITTNSGFDEANRAMQHFATSAQEQSQILGSRSQVLVLPQNIVRSAKLNQPEAVTVQLTQGIAAQTASQLLSKASSVASDAHQAGTEAEADKNQALSTASASAPVFLVTTVTDIEDATIVLLHGAEPTGQDLVGQVKSNFQNEVQAQSSKLKEAKTKTDTASAKMGAAAELARSAQLAADQGGSADSGSGTRGGSASVPATDAAALASDAATAQKGLTKESANLDVIGTVLSNAVACNKLSQLAEPAL